MHVKSGTNDRDLKRYRQFVLWVALAPALGFVQAVAAFAGVMLRH